MLLSGNIEIIEVVTNDLECQLNINGQKVIDIVYTDASDRRRLVDDYIAFVAGIVKELKKS